VSSITPFRDILPLLLKKPMHGSYRSSGTQAIRPKLTRPRCKPLDVISQNLKIPRAGSLHQEQMTMLLEPEEPWNLQAYYVTINQRILSDLFSAMRSIYHGQVFPQLERSGPPDLRFLLLSIGWHRCQAFDNQST
jgi:hypothetical protein